MGIHPAVGQVTVELTLTLGTYVNRQYFNQIHNALRNLPGLKTVTPCDFNRTIKVVIDDDQLANLGDTRRALSALLYDLGAPTDVPVYTN